MTQAAAMVGCTTVTASYAAYARVLAAGWRRFHPDAPFFVLLLDGDAAVLADSDLQVLTGEDLDVDPHDLEVRRGIYDPFELSTSLKAELLRTLLSQGHRAVVFLDSDTGVYGNLGDVGNAAAEHGVALSPHLVEPPRLDGKYPGELDILRYGVFNSGFIAVGAGAAAFLAWWGSLVRRDCIDDLRSGLHVDQYWLHSVPAYFGHTILRDPTLHVAHWNLHERDLELVEGGYLVDGQPLRTFHFSGFDPESPDRLHRYATPIPYRVNVAESPALAQILGAYAEDLIRAGHRESRTRAYAYGASSAGLPLGKWERAVYREAVLAREAGAQIVVPSPFAAADARAFSQLAAAGWRRTLSRPAVKRLQDARKIYEEQSPRRRSAAGFAARVRSLVRHRLGGEQGFHLAADRTALEYETGRQSVADDA